MSKSIISKVTKGRAAVIVAGSRTPFTRSNGVYKQQMAHDLGRYALQGLLEESAIDPALIDLVVMGTVVQDPRTTNVAREIALGVGLPQHIPAFTTTLACISANVAATTCVDQIRSGQIDVAIAGGTETFSDPPIRLSKNLRQALVKLQKVKSPMGYIDILKTLSPKDIIPDIPSATEFSTGESMGQNCDRLARKWNVSREESDEFAMRSHVLAAKAQADGHLDDDIRAVHLPPKFTVIKEDIGPRGNTTMEGLAKLRPAFDKKYGIVTAGSSSFLSDGASAVLLMSESKAKELKMPVLAKFVDYVYSAGDPLEELLMGPALTIPKLLERNGLTVDDIEVWEIHEAFAAQVVANLKALNDDNFAQKRLGMSKAVGKIPMEKLNIWGGSLSLGHPFGATGGRLLHTAARRLQKSAGRYAVVSGCAAGGQGSAILLENVSK